jgi:hypothetical protein
MVIGDIKRVWPLAKNQVGDISDFESKKRRCRILSCTFEY